MNRIGRERGWRPFTRQQFDYLCGPEGPLFVGTPQQITDKLLYISKIFGNTRFLGQLMLEGMPHEAVMRSTELFGKLVVPAVREALAVAA
jgi:alkanesulfonate monooxygenase SsuD/methylene tetrahydromethanopterin reductase-like flavin-dependent oxidoreductase (luciferase family)